MDTSDPKAKARAKALLAAEAEGRQQGTEGRQGPAGAQAGEAVQGDKSGPALQAQILDSHAIIADGIEARVSISKEAGGVALYNLAVPKPAPATEAYLELIKGELLRQVRITTQEVLDIKLMADLKQKFVALASKL